MRVTSEDGERDATSVAVEQREREARVPAGVAVPRNLAEIVDGYRDPSILDFGCGYGRSLTILLAAGLDVWGVDISDSQLSKARVALEQRGLDPGRVEGLNANGRAPFPDESFDVVFTTQVFEHVVDVDLVAAEIARLLRPGGTSTHDWPARWCVVEPHLHIPFVHWLPKNRTRRSAIALWRLLGRGAAARRVTDRRSPELVDSEYRYSIEQTFYRPPQVVAKALRAQGLKTAWARHPKVEALPGFVHPLALLAVRTLKTVRIVAVKPIPSS